jgi:hypothetical protein
MLINTVLLCFIYFDIPFSSRETKKQTTIIKADIKKIKKNRNDKIAQQCVPDTFLNDYASIISGIQPEMYFKGICQTEKWIEIQRKIDIEWRYVLDNKINKVTPWADRIMYKNTSSNNLIYPFAGSDFLYANLFYKSADSIIMIGLEDPGSIMVDTTNTNNFISHITQIEKSLYFLNHAGFFRTNSMKEDLKSPNLNGTLPTMLFYIRKLGYNISSIKYLEIDSSGNPIISNASRGYGYQIDYFKSDHVIRRLFYFKYDLSDFSLSRNKMFPKFLDKFSEPNVLLKSASYLMHNNSFSIIRNYLLNKSQKILQDDSGIPSKYFSSDTWNISMFGKYTKTIPLFKNSFQSDLFYAYQNMNIGNLPFSIGYNTNHGETNLMLSIRKKD